MATHTLAPHERLQAWQACHRLTIAVYKVSRKWPRDERYGLSAQVRAAAYSAGANIAEGYAREGPREFHRFLMMSLGSLAELHVGLCLARDIGLLTEDDWAAVEALRGEAGRLTGGLARAVRARR